MLTKSRTLLMSSLLGIASTQIVHAAPIALTFEPLAGTSSVPDFGPKPNPFSQLGFDFAFDAHPTAEGFDSSFYFIGPVGPCINDCTSNGTTVFFEFNDGVLSLKRNNGGTFSLLSLDAAQVFLKIIAPLELHVTGTLLGGGTVSTVFTNNASLAFATFTLPPSFSDLLSVTFQGSGVTEDSTSNFAIDNIVVDPLPEKVATAVAEPATTLLFAAGLLCFGVNRSRRRERHPSTPRFKCA